MSIDITLGLLTIFMTALGGFVSIHAPTKRSHKLIYALGFLLSGLASGRLVIQQSREMSRQSRESAGKVQKLESKQAEGFGQMQGFLQMIKRNTEKSCAPNIAPAATGLAQELKTILDRNKAPSTFKEKVLASIEEVRAFRTIVSLDNSGRVSQQSAREFWQSVYPSIAGVEAELKNRRSMILELNELQDSYDRLGNFRQNKIPELLDVLRKISADIE